MLRPYDMSSVVITGPKSQQENIIRELHCLKALHIVDHSKSELADIGVPSENASSLSETLVKIRAIMSSLGIKKNGNFKIKGEFLEIKSSVKKINEELNLILEEIRKTDAKLTGNDTLMRELELLEGIDIPLELFTSYKTLTCFHGYVKDDISSLKEELKKTAKNSLILGSEKRNKSFVVLFVENKESQSASSLLEKRNFTPVAFTSIQGLKGTPSYNLKKIKEESAKVQAIKYNAKRKLEKIGVNNAEFLAASEHFLSVQLEKSEAPLKFASTAKAFLVKGWIPTEGLKHSIDSLNRAGSGKIYIQFEPAKKHEKPPLKQKNPKLVKPFQFFMDLYSMPSYQEIDPTFFVFLTFPIFFGIMLGDIGYGLVGLILFWLLKKKIPKAKGFFNVLMLSSFVSIIFGLLYGEIFGLEEIGHYNLWHIISRAHDIIPLLAIAIVIGVIHVNIGLVIGIINVYRKHGFMAAIYEKASWIVLELGVAMLALSYMNMVAISPWIGAAFLGAAILMIFKGEGIKGIMELPGIFTNILSYARLMAIGLSSVKLAAVINESAGEMFHAGGFMILVGILILIVGHVINIMLGMLGSFLHSLRLHYVEFFSKFFTGGAKKFKPFGAEEE